MLECHRQCTECDITKFTQIQMLKLLSLNKKEFKLDFQNRFKDLEAKL
jgi:hypothetical protein